MAKIVQQFIRINYEICAKDYTNLIAYRRYNKC